MISKFKINDIQAEAILNIKLRALRKLEEEQIKTKENADETNNDSDSDSSGVDD